MAYYNSRTTKVNNQHVIYTKVGEDKWIVKVQFGINNELKKTFTGTKEEVLKLSLAYFL